MRGTCFLGGGAHHTTSTRQETGCSGRTLTLQCRPVSNVSTLCSPSAERLAFRRNEPPPVWRVCSNLFSYCHSRMLTSGFPAAEDESSTQGQSPTVGQCPAPNVRCTCLSSLQAAACGGCVWSSRGTVSRCMSLVECRRSHVARGGEGPRALIPLILSCLDSATVRKCCPCRKCTRTRKRQALPTKRQVAWVRVCVAVCLFRRLAPVPFFLSLSLPPPRSPPAFLP